jgi:hypothetical protein
MYVRYDQCVLKYLVAHNAVFQSSVPIRCAGGTISGISSVLRGSQVSRTRVVEEPRGSNRVLRLLLDEDNVLKQGQ